MAAGMKAKLSTAPWNEIEGYFQMVETQRFFFNGIKQCILNLGEMCSKMKIFERPLQSDQRGNMKFDNSDFG